MVELAIYIVSTVIVLYTAVLLMGAALTILLWALMAVCMPFVWAAKGLRWMYAASSRAVRSGLRQRHQPPGLQT